MGCRAADKATRWSVGYLLMTMQVGVGDQVNADQLRAIVSANQSFTALIESNFTLLATSLTDKLTDVLCNSQHSRYVLITFPPSVVLE